MSPVVLYENPMNAKIVTRRGEWCDNETMLRSDIASQLNQIAISQRFSTVYTFVVLVNATADERNTFCNTH